MTSSTATSASNVLHTDIEDMTHPDLVKSFKVATASSPKAGAINRDCACFEGTGTYSNDGFSSSQAASTATDDQCHTVARTSDLTTEQQSAMQRRVDGIEVSTRLQLFFLQDQEPRLT